MKNKSPAFFLFIAALFFFSWQPVLYGQDYSDDPLVVKVAVMGPGDELYFWWGHIGLIIEDRVTGWSRFYDWGVFSFEDDNFFINFAMGRLLYFCGASPPEWNLTHYINNNRDITIYTLNLPPEKKAEMLQYAEYTVLPENRYYYYHHFWDNCATRVRDIIDMSVNGQFREESINTEGRYTLRQHVRRHTWFNFFIDWALNFLMGRGIDAPITVWDEMFLPSEIGLRITDFIYTDSNGMKQNLVSSIEILNHAKNRPAVLDTPRPQWPQELAVGMAIAVFFVLLRFLRYKGLAAANVVWALTQGLLGFFYGLIGTLLFFMNFFTNHDYTFENINLLYINPPLLVAIWFGISYCAASSAEKQRKRELRIMTLWSAIFVLCLLSVIVNIFFGQKNLVDIALILPGTAVLSLLPELFTLLRRKFSCR